MASAEEYAAWIVANEGKKGTPEFETVANAYKIAKGQPTPTQAAPEAPERTLGQEVARQGGLTARAAITGISGLPGMLANVPAGIYNKGADIVQGEGQGFRFPDQTSVIANTLGLPKPEGGVERVVQDVAGGMAGTGGTAKVAGLFNPTGMVGQGIQNMLTQNIGTQTTAAAAAAGASGTTREMGGGWFAQLMAGLGAGVGVPMAYGAAKQVLPNTAGKFIEKSLDKSAKTDFAKEGERLAEATGIDLTPGARTGNKQVLALENASRQYGPTADRVQNLDVKLANQAIARVTKLADNISTNNVDEATLGTQIETTIKNAATRLDAVRGKMADRDYGRVRAIAGDQPVIGLTNLKDELKKIISQYENGLGSDAKKITAQAKAKLAQITPELGDGFAPPLSKIDDAMKNRSDFGKAARGGSNVFDDINPNANRDIAARLFGAINRDFEQTASNVTGNLKTALDKANKNYGNFSKSIEFLEKSTLGKLVGDDLADAALSGKTLSTTAGEDVIKKITNMRPSTRQASMDILNRWNPQLVKELKSNVLRDALAEGMAMPPSAKGASEIPLSFNRFVSALGSQKVGFEANLKSYGFSKAEIADIKDTAVAMMRAGDKTGFNFSNTNVQKEAMDAAGAIATGGVGVATGSPMIMGLAAKKAITIAGKKIGLEKIVTAMENPEGRMALRTVSDPKASPQAVIAAFQTIEGDQ